MVAALVGLPAASLAQTTADVEAALRTENWEGAARAFEQLEASGAATSDDYRSYATRLFRAERGEDALGVLQRGIARFPDATRFHYMIATLHRNAGRCSEAVRPYERFLDAQPDDPDALSGLARCYERVGRAPQAIDTWERYLVAETRTERADVRAEAEQSLARLRGETPASDPSDSGAATSVGAAAPAAGSPFAPVAPTDASSPPVATSPRPTSTLADGSSFADLASVPVTVAIATAADDAPQVSFPDAATALAAGDAAAQQRDWQTAREAWEAAATLDAGSVDAWYRAGVGAAILGDAEAAAVAFRRAQALAPEFAATAERAAQADARAAHEAEIALDRRGWHTDPGTRQLAAAEAFAAGRWLDGMRAQLGSDEMIDPLVVALRARAEGRPDEAAAGSLAAIALRPDDSARFLEAADASRLANDMVAARYLLEVYSRLGGADSERLVAVRAAIEREGRY